MEQTEQQEARFEFRVFDGHERLASIRQRLEAFPVDERSQRTDIYLLAIEEPIHNVKLRDGQLLDIKRLERVQGDLEQWRPVVKIDFPLFPEVLRADLFPAWEMVAPLFPRESYSQQELIEELVLPSPQLAALAVEKSGKAYSIDGVSAEYSRLTINGAALDTFAIEHEEPDRVQAVRAQLQLADAENVSYPLALKRLCGFKLSPYLQQLI